MLWYLVPPVRERVCPAVVFTYILWNRTLPRLSHIWIKTLPDSSAATCRLESTHNSVGMRYKKISVGPLHTPKIDLPPQFCGMPTPIGAGQRHLTASAEVSLTANPSKMGTRVREFSSWISCLLTLLKGPCARFGFCSRSANEAHQAAARRYVVVRASTKNCRESPAQPPRPTLRQRADRACVHRHRAWSLVIAST